MAVLTTTAAKDRKRDLTAELDRIVKILVKRYQPEKIILFGSLATNQVREWSDIDLCVVKKTELGYLDRLDEVMRLVNPNLAIDFFVYTPEEFEANLDNFFIRDEVLRQGRVLYDARGDARAVA